MGRQMRAKTHPTSSSSSADRAARSAAGRARHANSIGRPFLPPSKLDRQRYRSFRSGQTPQEIADRTKTSLAAVEASILRVRVDNQQYSAEEVGVEVRHLFADLIPEMRTTLKGALTATRYEGIITQFIDKATGEVQTVESQVERPDHDTRLKAIDAARGIIAVVQPRDPAVQITSITTNNTQNNLLGAGGGAGALGAGMTSPEAVIRAIQAQRGYALGDGSGSGGSGTGSQSGPVPVAAPTKIIEAEVEEPVNGDLGDEEESEDEGSEDEDEDEGYEED